jgi:hypothetical protein
VHSYSLALPGLDFQEAAASLSSEVQVFFLNSKITWKQEQD